MSQLTSPLQEPKQSGAEDLAPEQSRNPRRASQASLPARSTMISLFAAVASGCSTLPSTGSADGAHVPDQKVVEVEASSPPLPTVLYDKTVPSVDDNEYRIAFLDRSSSPSMAAHSLTFESALFLYAAEEKAGAVMVVDSNSDHIGSLQRVVADLEQLGINKQQLVAHIVIGSSDRAQQTSVFLQQALSQLEILSSSDSPHQLSREIGTSVEFSLHDGLISLVSFEADSRGRRQYHKNPRLEDGILLRKIPPNYPADRDNPARLIVAAQATDESLGHSLPTCKFDNNLPTVGVNDFMISGGDTSVRAIATYQVTACIAVSLWDPTSKLGALCHFRNDANGPDNLRMIVEELGRAGADTSQLQVMICGGSTEDDRTGKGRSVSEVLYSEIKDWAKQQDYDVLFDSGLTPYPYFNLVFDLESGKLYQIEESTPSEVWSAHFSGQEKKAVRIPGDHAPITP